MTQMLQNERNYFILFMVDKVAPKTSFESLRSFSQANPIAFSDIIYSFHSIFLQIPIFHDRGQRNCIVIIII